MWVLFNVCICFFFFKQKTAYEMRISDWSSDVCSSDLKSDVIGPNAIPLYKWAAAELGMTNIPKWNFHKYLIGRDGKLIAAFGTKTDPMDVKVTTAISAALAKTHAYCSRGVFRPRRNACRPKDLKIQNRKSLEEGKRES